MPAILSACDDELHPPPEPCAIPPFKTRSSTSCGAPLAAILPQRVLKGGMTPGSPQRTTGVSIPNAKRIAGIAQARTKVRFARRARSA